MAFDSTISFTFDTICPWTYLAKKRLDAALSSLSPEERQCFHYHFQPFQLHPETPQEGVSKADWYLRNMYNDNQDAFAKYKTAMTKLGEDVGVHFRFDGLVANTLQAHRVVQALQERKGHDVANAIVMALYAQYFEEGKHPSSRETLVEACKRAGVGADEAQALVDDESEGVVEVRALMREQAANGVDAVPYISIEGKRRDFGIQGAKEVAEFEKALRQCIKESR